MLFDKDIKKANLKAIGSFVGALSQVPVMAVSPNIYSALIIVAGISNGCASVREKRRFKQGEELFCETLDSDLYKECLAYYKEYVKDIADMYNELGFSSDLSTCIAYYFCLRSGIFSENQSYRYTVYKPDFDLFFEIMGSRVATGECCCRHNVSLLTDIINEQGGIAASFPVVTSNKTKIRKNKIARHVVTGVVHDDKKIMFDPTVHPSIVSDEAFSLIEDSGLYSTTIDNELHHHLKNHIGFDMLISNNERKQEVLSYESLDDIGLIQDVYVDSCMKVSACYPDFVAFYNDEKPKIKKLAKLNRLVVPHGDVIELEE